MTKYFVYILYSHTIDRYYVGYTNDLERRLSEHNRKKGKYTDRGIPWIIKHTEIFESKIQAKQREAYIKGRKSRAYIEEILLKGS